MNVEKENIKFYISLLGKPKLTSKHKEINKNEITIFYDRNHNGYGESAVQLDDRFKMRFGDALVKALITPTILKRDYDNFETIFEPFFEDVYTAKPLDGVVYKYYSDINKYVRKDGNISFLPPSMMNDPFDCSCEFLDGNDTGDLFKLFCTTPHKDNILMWSHYGDNHKGYCFEYALFDIVKEALNSEFDGILIYGKVDYSKDRKKHIVRKTGISYNYILDYIDAAFAKSNVWSYEDEIRFVLITKETKDHIDFRVPINKIYVGCKSDEKSITNSSGNNLPFTKMHKSDDEYKILE